MSKILTFILCFLVISVITIGIVYYYFHYVYREGAFDEWYEPFNYAICILVSAVYAWYFTKS